MAEFVREIDYEYVPRDFFNIQRVNDMAEIERKIDNLDHKLDVRTSEINGRIDTLEVKVDGVKTELKGDNLGKYKIFCVNRSRNSVFTKLKFSNYTRLRTKLNLPDSLALAIADFEDALAVMNDNSNARLDAFNKTTNIWITLFSAGLAGIFGFLWYMLDKIIK